MELSLRQYKDMRLSGMTDKEILEAMHYSPDSNKVIIKWKKANGVQLGKSKLHLLDIEEVKELLKTHDLLEVSVLYNIEYGTFRDWAREQKDLIQS